MLSVTEKQWFKDLTVAVMSRLPYDCAGVVGIPVLSTWSFSSGNLTETSQTKEETTVARNRL